jgi:hypothetical protein
MSTMATEPENRFAGQGWVLLDIGDDVGAVVVTMPASMEGEEVEIRPDVRPHAPASGHVHHPHVAVVNRPVEGGLQPSLVFPEVRQGTYGLYLKGDAVRRLAVTVAGGEVTSAEWPG